jgi:crossover junction endodeoxyribonuclease RusA
MSRDIVLPWPPKELSPNARLHWRAVHKAKAAYKDQCHYWILEQRKKLRDVELSDGRIPLLITISPPDRRKRDRDNLQSSLKYALDSLAIRLGVDDYLFDPSYTFGEPVEGGRVTVRIG